MGDGSVSVPMVGQSRSTRLGGWDPPRIGHPLFGGDDDRTRTQGTTGNQSPNSAGAGSGPAKRMGPFLAKPPPVLGIGEPVSGDNAHEALVQFPLVVEDRLAD